MEPLIRQLEHVRRRARVLLVLMRSSTWLATVLAVAVLAGLADYVLRLPGGVRLGLLMLGVAAGGIYLIHMLGRAVRVRPRLPALALRLERLYPASAGRLASAIAFATQGPVGGESPVTVELARRTADSAEGVLQEDQVDRLIDPRPAFRAVLGLAVVVGLFSGIALGAPDGFSTAVRRWTDPLGPARWPNRHQVQSLTTRRVAASNAPLALSAQVLKGDHPRLRTWLVYRFVRDTGSPGAWQRQLMTRQNDAGVYERLLEPNPTAGAIEFFFEAGDDATHAQTIKLIQPPTLTALIAELAPPTYAAQTLPIDRQDLLQPPRPSVTIDALEGSRVRLRMTVQGSLRGLDSAADSQQVVDWLSRTLDGLGTDLDPEAWSAMMPEHTVLEAAAGATQFEVAFNLLKPVRFRLRFADAYGGSYEDARLFAFEVRADRLPRAAVTEPPSDPMVLPTAVLPLAAEGNDDVAIGRLELESRRAGQSPAALGRDEPQAPRARVEARLDLAPLGLKPGDEVVLVAVARDNFRLNGREHDPVESAPRTLRIISPDELSRQLHSELAELRQRALRAAATQRQLIDAPATPAASREQQELGERLAGIKRAVVQLQDRVELNRHDDEAMSQILDKADQLLREAGRGSAQAAERLAAAAMDPSRAPSLAEQARASQRDTAQKIDELTQLLDQGRDAYELKQNLIRIAREQQGLGEQVKTTLPRTLGQELDQLEEAQRRQLSDTARKQSDLAEQTRSLAERMRSTAAALSRQSENPDEQAMAEALRQAAETATREQLDQKMEQAAQQAGQNRLADARQSQQQAEQVLRQMLEQIDRAEQLKQQILRRKLTELVEAIRRLRDQQQAQLDRLLAAQRFEDLDAPMLTLRRNTMSVSEAARRVDEKAGPVADALDRAAGHQGEAIEELRAAQVARDRVEVAERAALGALEEALKLAQELSSQAQQQLTEDERRKLVEGYARALEAQAAVRDQTKALHETPGADRNRRWRADALKLSKAQEEVGTTLSELKAKVQDTVVYRSVHEHMERWIAAATEDLSDAQPSRGTLFRQEQTLSSIQSLMNALKQDPPDEEFAEGEQGGGGGQGEGGDPPLIPPLAELKLLRAQQQTIYDTTQVLEGLDDPQVRPTILQEVATQQDSLAKTGRQLLTQLQQQGGPQLEPARQEE